MRRSTENRRKDEICRLRAQAAELEAQAVILRCLASMNPNVSPPLAPIGLDIGELNGKRVTTATAWRDLARTHKRLHDMSNTENARLRRLVERQRKTIASIRRLLQRQMSQYDSYAMTALRTDSSTSSMPSDDMQLLEHLRLDVEGDTFKNSLRGLSLSGVQTRGPGTHVRRISASRLSLSFFETRKMPFHFEALATTLWTKSVETYNSYQSLIEQRVVERNGTLLTSYCAEHCVDGRSFKMCGGVAIRRYYQSDRIEFVFSGMSRPMEVQGEPMSGITMRETGIAVCSSFEMALLVEIEVDTTIAKNETHLNAVIATLAQINPVYCDQGLTAIEGALLRQQISV